MRLEPVGAEAAERLAALHATAFDHPWSAADLRSALEIAGTFALATLDETGAATGFILARALAGEGEILTLAVAPDRRRAGLGRVLVEAAANLCAAAGAEDLFLEVAQDNDAARALYLRCGFAFAGLRKGYYRRNGAAAVDALMMRRTLNTRAP